MSETKCCSKAEARVDFPDAESPVNQMVRPYNEMEDVFVKNCCCRICSCMRDGSYLLTKLFLALLASESALVPSDVCCDHFDYFFVFVKRRLLSEVGGRANEKNELKWKKDG